MADYIERDELLADLRLARSLTPGLPYEGPMAEIVDTFFDMIATYPAADVAPVKRGEWKNTGRRSLEYYGYLQQCSACEKVTSEQFNFCPNCGADMTGENA